MFHVSLTGGLRNIGQFRATCSGLGWGRFAGFASSDQSFNDPWAALAHLTELMLAPVVESSCPF